MAPRAPGADAPVGTQPVLIESSARRLFCDDSGCASVTVAEQVEALWLTAVTVGECPTCR
ncbi:hypothetical protein ADK75_24660 [Streptomyces virginiae]|uniref:Uncharacterized protein n=1 Tax=Streptomyces virginiae TaxID=1961 RepID=A0A0L8M9Z4_STRVG|nr:hypothetical protein ADK75_24660 [Streptomyces virginiae]